VRREDELSGIAALVRGDERRARELRGNLALFARQSGDLATRRLVVDVLAGRRDVRDVLRSAEFTRVCRRRLANVERALAELTDEQRAALLGPDHRREDADFWAW
jgi:transcription elongation GreA/GreB family factor